MPDRLKELEAEGRLVSDLLLRWFAPASTLRFAYGAITRDAVAAVQGERQAELDALRSSAEAPETIAELLKLADEEIGELKRQRDQLDRRLSEVEADLTTAKANVAALSVVQGQEPAPPNLRWWQRLRFSP